jgi:excisionase family DNA binding protein
VHVSLTSRTPGPARKYGLARPCQDSYAPPISEPDSTPGHPWHPRRHGAAERPAHEARTHMASMAVNELGPMLTATEVADMLHLHVNTVKRLGDRGELPFYRVCKRGDRRFRLDDVIQFLARNR